MLRSLVGILLLAPSLAAQDVRLNARIVEVDAAVCPPYQYKVEGTSVFLDDTLLDLEPFVDEIVLVRGNEQFSPASCAPLVVEVTSVDSATATLTSCGTNGIGCPMRFLVGPHTISVNLLLFSIGQQSYLNLGELGVLFLGQPLLVLDPGPGGVTDIVVPDNPSLIGVDVTLQGFHQEVGPIGDPGMLTNPVSFQIVVAFLCHPADCSF